MLPGVLKVYPENNSNNIELDSFITIEFDQKIDVLSVTSENVRVINKNTSEIVTSNYNIELLEDLCTIKLTPQMLMPYRTDFKVEVSNIISWNLERMLGTYDFAFETKDGTVVGEDEYPNIDDKPVIPDDKPVHPIAPIYTVSAKTSITGKYLTSNKFYIEFSAVDEYGIKSTDVYITTEGFKYENIFITQNDNFTSPEEAGILGTRTAICSPGNTTVFRNKIIVDLNKLDTDVVIESGVPYYLVIGEIPVVVDNVETHTSKPVGNEFILLKPMYSTVQSVYSYFTMINLERFIEEEDVAYRIYENSKMAEYIVKEAGNEEKILFDPPDVAVINYVTEKTKYDMMFAKYLSMTSAAQRKKLDDLEIEYGYSLSELMSMLDKLKKDYQKWEDMLSGNRKAKMATFNKGSDVDSVPAYIKSREVKGW